jgi:hypothetical protein
MTKNDDDYYFEYYYYYYYYLFDIIYFKVYSEYNNATTKGDDDLVFRALINPPKKEKERERSKYDNTAEGSRFDGRSKKNTVPPPGKIGDRRRGCIFLGNIVDSFDTI